ncbi:MAG TPA: hypothetical protein VF323_00605 [Candidatus Limnocylindrales bacterium]
MTQPTQGPEPAPPADDDASAVGATAPTTGVPPADPASGPSSVRTVQYKGAELDAERGPGLGCFRFQLIVLVTLLVVTPIGVSAGWPDWLTTVLLFATLGLLLVAGQTIIFLLRLVAADRRGRRRPLASSTRTIGELDDAAGPAAAGTPDTDAEAAVDAADDPGAAPSADGGDRDRSMRQ